MADMSGLQSIPASGDGNRLLHSGRYRHLQGVVRLLDTMPWWALVVIALLTFAVLHELAGVDVEQANHAGAMDAAASRVIIKILAGAGQYLFSAILLAEAAGALIASRRIGPRDARQAESGAREGKRAAANLMTTDELMTGLASLRELEKKREVRGVWSTGLLNSIGAQRFAALVTLYYREKGVRSAAMRLEGGGGTVLKLFQDDSGKASVVVQFRAQRAPWVGPRQIEALREVMDGERVAKGLFMTPGAFSKDAKECARLNGVTLVDGKLFLMMIRRLPPAAQERLLSFATHAG
jgi:hypothetical protein